MANATNPKMNTLNNHLNRHNVAVIAAVTVTVTVAVAVAAVAAVAVAVAVAAAAALVLVVHRRCLVVMLMFAAAA